MPKEFRDKEDRIWKLPVSLNTICELEDFDYRHCYKSDEEVRISFFPPQEDLFTDVITNSRVVLCMLWVICEEQAKERGINEIDEFADIFEGEHIQQAKEAFYSTLPPFFPQHQTALEALTERYSKLMEIANKKLQERLDSALTDEEMEKFVEEHLPEVSLTQNQTD